MYTCKSYQESLKTSPNIFQGVDYQVILENTYDVSWFFFDRTSIKTSTCSKALKQLCIAASYLPTHIPYGYGNSAAPLHTRMTPLQDEYWIYNNASTSSPSDENTSSSPVLPLMQTWTCRMCDQPLFGALHVNIKLKKTLSPQLNMQISVS